jgi:hypothetical protein
MGAIWNGRHPEDGSELTVEQTIPGGFTPPDLDAEPQLTAPLGPDIDAPMFADIATSLVGAEAREKCARNPVVTAVGFAVANAGRSAFGPRFYRQPPTFGI